MSAQQEKRIVELVINGKSAEVSLNQVKKEVILLTREFSKLKEADDPKLYKQKASELKQLTAVYKEMRSEITGTKTEAQKFFDSFKTIAAGVMGGNLITGVMTDIQSTMAESIKMVKDLSDEFTNIEKTTNLTSEEIQILDDKLGKLNTRTARKDLREFAAEAGKMGKASVDAVMKFVEEADMINVALGEDLGKEAVIEIMKLADIFDEEALNIGSSINSIGQASVATERFQVDFLQRTSGIGKELKMTSDQLLGYGAALEIAGQSQEVSGTAFGVFLQSFTKNTEEWGHAAGMAAGEMSKLVKDEGINAGFVKFLQNFDASSKGAKDLLTKMEDLDIEGQRGSGVLLSLAQNAGEVVKQQLVATKSMGSIVTEFTKRNENDAAKWEKTLKKVHGAIMPIMQTIGGFLIGVGTVLGDNIKGLLTFAKVILVGAVAWGTYKAVALAVILLEKIRGAEIAKNTTLLALQRAGLLAGAAVQAVFTGNLGRATAAMRAFNATAALNPWGLILSAVALTVTAIALFSDKTRKLSETQKALSESSSEAAKSIATEKNEMDRNVAILKDKNQHEAVREAALKRLIALNPAYLNGLTLENINTKEGQLLLMKYNNELMRGAEIKAKIAKADQLSQEVEDLRLQAQTDASSGATWWDKTKNAVSSASNPNAGFMLTLKNAQSGLININNEIKAKQDAITRLNSEITNLQVKEPSKYVSEITGESYLSEADMKKAETAKKKADAYAAKAQRDKDKAAKHDAKSAQDLAKQKEDQAKKDAEVIAKEYDLSIEYSARKFRMLEAQAAFARAEGLMSEKEYQDYLAKLEMDALDDRLQIHKTYGKDLSEIYYDIGVATLKAQKRAHDDFVNNVLVQPKGTFSDPKKKKKGKDGEEEDPKPPIENALELASASADVMQNMHDIQMHNLEKEFNAFKAINDEKKKELDYRLEHDLISQEEYQKQVEALDADTAAKKKIIQETEWKKQHRQAIVEATINGILAVTKVLANPALAIITGIAAATQVAAIANTPMPQFYQGGNTMMVTGASDGRRYNAKRVRTLAGGGRFTQPTVGLIGEKGPELVIPNYIYGNPKYANVMGALEAAIGVKQYGNGGDTGMPTAGGTDNTQMAYLIKQNTETMAMLYARLQAPLYSKTYFKLQEFWEADDLEKKAKELGTF